MAVPLPDTAFDDDAGHIADHNMIVDAIIELRSSSGASNLVRTDIVAGTNITTTPSSGNSVIIASPLTLIRSNIIPGTNITATNGSGNLVTIAAPAALIKTDIQSGTNISVVPGGVGSNTVTINALSDPNKMSASNLSEGTNITLDKVGQNVTINASGGGGGGWTAVDASETVKGILELATSGEVITGTNPSTAVTPDTLQDKIDAHKAEGAPHPDLQTQINGQTSILATKADLIGAYVDADQILTAVLPDPDTIPMRTSTGALAVVDAAQDNEAINLAQGLALFASTIETADVRHAVLASGSLPLNSTTDGTTFTAIPTLRVTDAASGDLWRCEYALKYRSPDTPSSAGITVQHKSNVSAPTNILPNPTLATVLTGWSKLQGTFTAPTRETTTGRVDSTSLRMLATGATVMMTVSDWFPALPGSTWTAGAYALKGVGTAREARVDIQERLSDGVTLGTTRLGTNITPNGSTWTRSTTTTAMTLAANAAWVRVRLVYGIDTLVSGDSVFWDDIQLENSFPLPAYGSTGGGGSSALTFDGWWDGLLTTATSTNDYTRRQLVRSGVGDLTASFGGIGTSADAQLWGSFYIEVGGTGLTNQEISLEFKQRQSNATACQILSGNATMVKIP